MLYPAELRVRGIGRRKENDAIHSDLRFPTRFVVALPHLHGGLVANDVTVLRVAIQRAAGALRNIAQMAKQRTGVADLNL